MFIEISSHLDVIYDGWECTQLSLYFPSFQSASIALEYMGNHRKMTFLPTETARI